MNITRTFTTGKGWRHLTVVVALMYDLFHIGAFDDFGPEFFEVMGQTFTMVFIGLWISVAVEIWQGLLGAKLSASDVLWGTVAAALAWIGGKYYPSDFVAWVLLVVGSALTVYELWTYLRKKKFKFRFFNFRL